VSALEREEVIKLILAIQQFSNKAIAEWTRLTNHNLGISPVIALSELKKHGPRKQKELADTLGLTPGAMTSIGNKLIKHKLAKRKYDPNDRRTIYLEITDEGLEVLEDSFLKGQFLHLELLKVLNEREIQQLSKIYKKLLGDNKSL